MRKEKKEVKNNWKEGISVPFYMRCLQSRGNWEGSNFYTIF